MGIQVGYPEGFPGLEDEEPLKLAEKSFFGNAVSEAAGILLANILESEGQILSLAFR
jgi:hypothetical protein